MESLQEKIAAFEISCRKAGLEVTRQRLQAAIVDLSTNHFRLRAGTMQ